MIWSKEGRFFGSNRALGAVATFLGWSSPRVLHTLTRCRFDCDGA
jgi:hypothetical protein